MTAHRAPSSWRAAAGLVAMWTLLTTASIAFSSRTLLALAPATLAPLPVLMSRARGRRFDPLDPLWLFSAAFLLTYALIPSLQLVSTPEFESISGMLKLSPAHYIWAVALGGLGFLAFLAGYFGRIAGRLSAVTGQRAAADSSRVRMTAGLLGALGLIALVATMVLVAAWDYSPREIATGRLREGILATLGGRGYLSVGFLCLSLGASLGAILIARWGLGGPQRHGWAMAGMAAMALIPATLFALVLGSRQLAVVTVVQVVVVVHLVYRPIPRRVIMGAFGALAAASVMFISLRNTGVVTINPMTWVGYAGKTFDGFNFLVDALARVHRLDWGRSIGEDALYTYLPRALFPDKPEVFGIVRAQDAVIPGLSATVGNTSTFPPGILAEGYVNFGVVGLLGLPFVTGIALRVAYEWAVRTRAAVAIVLFGYLLGNQTGLLRGFGQMVAAIGVIVVLLSPLLVLPQVRSPFRRGTTTALGCAAMVAAALVLPVLVHPAVRKSDLTSTQVPPVLKYPLLARHPALQKELRGAATQGQAAVLLVTSSWCDGCIRGAREVARVTRSEGARLVVIDYQDDEPGRLALRGATRRRALVVDDSGGLSLATLHAPRLPTVVVVDHRSPTACQVVGHVTDGVLRAAIETARTNRRCS